MSSHRGTASALREVQAGRQDAREVVLPERDVPRHGDEPRRRGRSSSCSRSSGTRPRATPNGDKSASDAGILGKVYDEKADSGTFSFVPRPDWYFYFLFYLLRIFKWPDSVILGTVGIPTVCIVLLLAVPFFDRRTERRLSRRPVAVVASILVVISMGVLTWKGATATESLGEREHQEGPELDQAEQPPAERDPGREAVRPGRLPQLPQLPGHGRRLRRRAGPLGGRLEGQGHQVPDRPSQVPVLREPGLADAAVLRPRRREAQRPRDLPRGEQGRQIARPREG